MLERRQYENAADVARIEAVEGASPGDGDEKVEEAGIEDMPRVILGVGGEPEGSSCGLRTREAWR